MRIVSLAPSNTEILFALGAGDQVVACTAYCDYPPEAKKLPKVGGWTTISNELIRKYQPDLILTSTIVQKDAKKRFAGEKFRVEHINVVTVADILKSIERISELIGKRQNAKRLKQEIKQKLESLRTTDYGLRTSKLKVYIEEWFDPPMASGNWVIELIEIAGGVPMLKRGDISRATVLSEVEGFDPDVIILAYCGYMDKSDPQIIKKRWPKLRAVKEGKIFVIDERVLNRPGPRIWQAADQCSQIITDTIPFLTDRSKMV